ncbi:MAG: DNA polymerase III subunit alpha [Thermodesulfovibrionia bacterium]
MIRIDELIEKALHYKLPAVAITDHGNLFGAIEFYRRLSMSGIKPIIGCEVYVARNSRFEKGSQKNQQETPFHLILLCKDMDGYKNLLTLVSKAYIEGFYYKPRIDKDLLSQYCGGLICLSSCLKGEVPCYLSLGMIEKARESALWYKNTFGPDNFFLELQANELPEQEAVNRQLVELGRELHIGLVATNDSHYLNRGDARAHDSLLCIQTGKTIKDTDRMRFAKDTFYLKGPEEMWNAFKDIPEAIRNTRAISERCNLDIRFDRFRLPYYKVHDGEEISNYLRRLAIDGLKRKIKKVTNEYSKRLETELNIIDKMGFSSYFLIVWDIIQYAKGRGIPVGPGRGSAAGSLVAYSLDITEIDPLRYGLLFERFLNPERVSMPDIDIDFCMDRRSEVIEYVSNKYGRDHVAQIITFGTMKARAAIRDVGRVMNIPYSDVDRIAKLVPPDPKITIKKALEIEPRLVDIINKRDDIRELIEIAERLEGISRHASTHAAGIVISPEPLTEMVPLYKAPNEDVITTQYDMEAIKKLGLLKFDFLGLKTLTVINKAEGLINAKHDKGMPFSIKDIPLDDKETYSLLSSARTTGIFQLESSGMREILYRLRPESFEDLIALVALYRPGPIGSGMIDEFIKSKRGGDSRQAGTKKLGLPQLDKILEETHGIVLYQEQVMEIAHRMANFTLSQADILRKAMGGKDPEEMEKLKNTFIEGLKSNRVSEKKAVTLYNLILQFAQYGFNKSHSAAYALIAYRTAYLKAHYPVPFMAASLSADMDNTDKVVSYINECKEMGIEILPPDINKSEREFTITGNAIRFGLEAVKGVGASAIEAILEVRRDREFSSFFDFCTRVDTRKVNRKVIESLIKAGAFDSMGKRAQLMGALDTFIEGAARFQREASSAQRSMFDSYTPLEEGLPDVKEWSETKRLTMEKEALGFYITGHPLNNYKDEMERLNITPIGSLKELKDKEDVTIGGIVLAIKEINTKKGERMAYLTIEDLYGTIEAILFPDIYREAEYILSMDRPIIINGNIDRTEKGIKVVARKIGSIDNAKDVIGDKGFKPSNYGKMPITLTMYKTMDDSNLLKLRDILSRYSGDCPLYIKVVSEGEWEAVLATTQYITPSEEMIAEVKGLLGEKAVIL